jgi:hypothetical protein
MYMYIAAQYVIATMYIYMYVTRTWWCHHEALQCTLLYSWGCIRHHSETLYEIPDLNSCLRILTFSSKVSRRGVFLWFYGFVFPAVAYCLCSGHCYIFISWLTLTALLSLFITGLVSLFCTLIPTLKVIPNITYLKAFHSVPSYHFIISSLLIS